MKFLFWVKQLIIVYLQWSNMFYHKAFRCIRVLNPLYICVTLGTPKIGLDTKHYMNTTTTTKTEDSISVPHLVAYIHTYHNYKNDWTLGSAYLQKLHLYVQVMRFCLCAPTLWKDPHTYDRRSSASQNRKGPVS